MFKVPEHLSHARRLNQLPKPALLIKSVAYPLGERAGQPCKVRGGKVQLALAPPDLLRQDIGQGLSENPLCPAIAEAQVGGDRGDPLDQLVIDKRDTRLHTESHCISVVVTEQNGEAQSDQVGGEPLLQRAMQAKAFRPAWLVVGWPKLAEFGPAAQQVAASFGPPKGSEQFRAGEEAQRFPGGAPGGSCPHKLPQVN